MRIFIAVFPPRDVREELFRAASGLSASDDFRLVSQEKIHLTLKFLGDVARDDLGRVKRALEPVRERHEPFEVSTSGFGAFPSEKRARILWVGIEDGSGPLRSVARDVEDLLEPAGFGREARSYLPHLTLGRARGRRAKFDDSGNPPPALRFTISGVELVESVPGENGVDYCVLEAYSF